MLKHANSYISLPLLSNAGAIIYCFCCPCQCCNQCERRNLRELPDPAIKAQIKVQVEMEVAADPDITCVAGEANVIFA